MEGGADRENDRPTGSPLAGDRNRPLDGLVVSADNDLPRSIVVCYRANLVGLASDRLDHHRLGLLDIEAEQRRHRPSPRGTTLCIVRPRSFTRRTASATVTPRAAANAEYSPRECPATYATCRPNASPPSTSSTRITASLAANSAGWAFSVKVSSLSGPSNIKRERRCDKVSSTSSNRSRAAGKASARLRPMPTAW